MSTPAQIEAAARAIAEAAGSDQWSMYVDTAKAALAAAEAAAWQPIETQAIYLAQAARRAIEYGGDFGHPGRFLDLNAAVARFQDARDAMTGRPLPPLVES